MQIKTLFSLFLLLLLSVFLLQTGCSTSKKPGFIRSSPPVTLLIPDGFKGDLRVVYNEPCGVQPQVENGRRLFQFPSNGVLILQSKSDFYDTKDADYYFVDAAGGRKKIVQVIDKQQRYTTDKNGAKLYLNNGNTTLKNRVESEPGVVIKGTAFMFLEVVQYVNGKLMNENTAGAEYMEYGVYNAGPIDSTTLVLLPDRAKVVKELVRACRKENKAKAVL